MDDIGAMQLPECPAQRRTQCADRRLGQRARQRDGIVQRRAEDVFRGQPGRLGEGSASTTVAPWWPPMTRAASVSSRKRVREAGSDAMPGCIVLSATVRPPGDRAR